MLLAAVLDPNVTKALFLAGLIFGVVAIVLGAMNRSVEFVVVGIAVVCVALPLAWNALAV